MARIDYLVSQREAVRSTPQHFDLPDQAGRLAAGTGANSGIGLETPAGWCWPAPRSGSRCAARPGVTLRVAELDLFSLDSGAPFAAWLVEANRPVDLLVNNAGIMNVPTRRTTADGFGPRRRAELPARAYAQSQLATLLFAGG